MNFRSELCQDKHTAGFLLKAESDTWPLACLWTGNYLLSCFLFDSLLASDINGSCAPAPSRDSNFDYINAIEWRNEVRVSLDMICRLNHLPILRNSERLFAAGHMRSTRPIT